MNRTDYLNQAIAIRELKTIPIDDAFVKMYMMQMIWNMVPCFEDEIANAFEYPIEIVTKLYAEALEEVGTAEEILFAGESFQDFQARLAATFSGVEGRAQ